MFWKMPYNIVWYIAQHTHGIPSWTSSSHKSSARWVAHKHILHNTRTITATTTTHKRTYTHPVGRIQVVTMYGRICKGNSSSISTDRRKDINDSDSNLLLCPMYERVFVCVYVHLCEGAKDLFSICKSSGSFIIPLLGVVGARWALPDLDEEVMWWQAWDCKHALHIVCQEAAFTQIVGSGAPRRSHKPTACKFDLLLNYCAGSCETRPDCRMLLWPLGRDELPWRALGVDWFSQRRDTIFRVTLLRCIELIHVTYHKMEWKLSIRNIFVMVQNR